MQSTARRLPGGSDGTVPATAIEAPPLGSYEGLSEQGRFADFRGGCPRWPEGLWLRWRRGEISGIVPGRCGATNQCGYCAVQAAHETARMLSLDVVDDPSPRLLLVLGTRTVTEDTDPFYYARQEVIRQLRDRFGREVEYASLQEFTTGFGPRSGGQRRPHWNLFVKGIVVELLDQVRELVRCVWCAHVDAEPEYQYVEALRDGAAAAHYVALHFQKEGQAPPQGWRGQRFNASRGYFGALTRAEARQRARASLQLDRELYKAYRDGLQGDAAQLRADEAIAEAAATTWDLYHAPRRRREEVTHEPTDEIQAGAAPGSPLADRGLGRVLDPPPRLRVGDRQHVDVTSESQRHEGPPPARAGVAPPPAALRLSPPPPTAADLPDVTLADAVPRPGRRIEPEHQVDHDGQANRSRSPG